MFKWNSTASAVETGNKMRPIIYGLLKLAKPICMYRSQSVASNILTGSTVNKHHIKLK